MPRKKSSASTSADTSKSMPPSGMMESAIPNSMVGTDGTDPIENNSEPVEKPQPAATVAKKRGRRPKGGKIIVTDKPIVSQVVTMQENIILHLRCSLEDIKDNGLVENSMTDFTYNPDIENVEAYSAPQLFSSSNNQSIQLNYHELSLNEKSKSRTKGDTQTNSKFLYEQEDFSSNNMHDPSAKNETDLLFDETTPGYASQDLIFEKDDVLNEVKIKESMESSNSYEKYMSMINTKLHHLSKELHTDDIKHKRSACFWCTCDFDSEVVHIPKYNMNERYHVYGCFCSPQCATAFLMNERVDSSIKFERYQLMNNLYGKVYNYQKNIKPAPNPYYVLDKFYGSLDIQEFRDLLLTNRSLVVIDKPMTHVFPELYEDNEDFIVSKRTIPKNNSAYTVRKSTSSSKK